MNTSVSIYLSITLMTRHLHHPLIVGAVQFHVLVELARAIYIYLSIYLSKY